MLNDSYDYECTGCDCVEDVNTPGPACNDHVIQITFFDADLVDWEVPSGLVLKAEAYLPECGTVTDEYTIPSLSHLGLVTTTTNCNEMIIEYKDSLHVIDNSYTWNFFAFDFLATRSADGRSNTFNTSEVFSKYQEVNTQTNSTLPLVLPYRLEINNEQGTIQSDSMIFGYAPIPECTGYNSLVVYPNPSSDVIYVEIKGKDILKGNFNGFNDIESAYTQLSNNGKYLIFNSNFQLAHSVEITSTRQMIDVSSLKYGIYYLFTSSNKGITLYNKFIILN